MLARARSTVLAAAVAGAAMVPLYGDPAPHPVTHSEWARMVLRALDLEAALPLSATASRAFSLLTWNESLAFDGEQYLHAEGLQRSGQGAVTAGAEGGEAHFGVAVARPGSYRLRARLEGDPARPVAAELREPGQAEPDAHLTLVPRAQPAWVDGGEVHLEPGVYNAALILGPGTRLHRVELDPPCLSPVEPPGGWQALRVLQRDELAVTALQAADLEWKLPTAAPPVEVAAAGFQAEPQLRTAAAGEADELRAGPEGLRGLVFVDIAEEGLHTIWVEGVRGSGQRWLADDCRKAVLCPRPDATATAWHVVMTARFTAGRHFLTVEMGEGAVVRRLRAERKRDTPADYVQTLRELGFDPGPAGAVERARATEAMRWIEGKRRELGETGCGDLRVMPPAAGALALAAPVAPPQAAVPPGFAGQPTDPGAPLVPPPDTPAGSPVLPE